MPGDSSDWKSEIAQRVCTLVRDPNVLARFRAQCAAFPAEQNQDEQNLAAWERRRKEHCESGLATLRDFKTRTKKSEGLSGKALERTRPAADTKRTWVFDYYQTHLTQADFDRLGWRSKVPWLLIGFSTWVPPDLALAASPKLTVPGLFGRLTGKLHSPRFGTTIQPGPASLAEKYASVAAIHDACFPEREPINELLHASCGKLTEELRKRERDALRAIVRALTDTARANILEWLADVDVDVAQHVGPPTQPIGTDLAQGGRGCRLAERVLAENTSHQENRMRWLQTIAECVHEDTRNEGQREYYLRMVRNWAARTAKEGRWRGIQLRDFLLQEHPEWSEAEIDAAAGNETHKFGGEPMKFRDDSIAVTTHPTTPTDKKYATLAAVHDEYCHCDHPLAPWRGVPFRNPFREDATEQDAEELAAQGLFDLLRERVTALTEEDRGRIERLLDEISRDLKDRDPLKFRPSEPAKPGRKPKTQPNKVDLIVRRMIDCGDVERYARKWKTLRGRYQNELPKRMTSDGLRKRVEREEQRRAADRK